MIELQGLTKKFGSFFAVRDLWLQVPRGEIFGLLGPNGAGKTTTIRMVTGLMKPTSGKVLLEGIDVFRKPGEAKALLGYIPDRPYLYEKLTGGEFLEFVAGLHQMGREDRWEKRSQKLLEYFDLLPWRGELIESYSHGMRQRLIIIAALLHRPKGAKSREYPAASTEAGALCGGGAQRNCQALGPGAPTHGACHSRYLRYRGFKRGAQDPV